MEGHIFEKDAKIGFSAYNFWAKDHSFVKNFYLFPQIENGVLQRKFWPFHFR